MKDQDFHILGEGDDIVVVRRRPVQPDDTALLFNSWCRQIRGKRPFDKMSNEDFKLYVDNIIRKIVVESDIDVAYPEGDPSVVIGFLCCDRELRNLHYLYIKKDFRRGGVASWLMRQRFGDDLGKCGLTLTHALPYWKHYKDKWKLELKTFDMFAKGAK